MDREGSMPGHPRQTDCAGRARRSQRRRRAKAMGQEIERACSPIGLDASERWVNWAMSRALRGLLGLALLLSIASSAHAAGVPADCEQLVVGVAPDWNSMRGTLQRFERS